MAGAWSGVVRCRRLEVIQLFAVAVRRRTAHNPVNSELLDYMDRVGMLVWSENRNLERQVIGAPRPSYGAASASSASVSSDGRTAARARLGAYGTEIDTSTFPDPMYLADAAAMVLRDRNHPSIIVWSLCNEGGCMQSDPLGGIVASAFKNTILDIDGSRPITANSEDYPGDTLTRITDVEAFSYNCKATTGALTCVSPLKRRVLVDAILQTASTTAATSATLGSRLSAASRRRVSLVRDSSRFGVHALIAQPSPLALAYLQTGATTALQMRLPDTLRPMTSAALCLPGSPRRRARGSPATSRGRVRLRPLGS